MGVQVEIRVALEAFRWNEAEYENLLKNPVMQDLVKRAIRVEAAAKNSMGQEAPPSTPGRPPAVRTGRLRSSITWRPGEDGISPYVDVGSAVVYAPYVEMGTSNMEARPYLRPALEAARASF